MRERAKRASASEIYVFSGLQIHLHVYISTNAVVWHYKWQYDWQNTNIEKIYEYASERSERA